MSALALVGLVLYGAVALLCLRPLTGHFAWWQVTHWWRDQERPDDFDWSVALLGGLVTSALWPVALVAAAVVRAVRALPSLPSLPPIGEERAALRRADAERLREMERQLGLERLEK